MGLLDQLAGHVLGSLGGGQGQGGSDLQHMLLQAVLGLIQNGQGGLGGLVAQLNQAGLGEQVASWVGTGQNLPVSADQISQALGGRLGDMAAQLGLPPDQVAGHVAEMLPQVVDHLTPDGQMPQGGDLLSAGLSALGGLFGKA